MSDSDDMSISGSDISDEEFDDLECGAGDDTLPIDIEQDGDIEVDNEIGSNASNNDQSWFQKEMWQLKKLPYYPELVKQANDHLGQIKAGLAYSVILNDPPSFTLWVQELELYLRFYGLRLPKEDHILFIKLLMTTVRKGELYHDVKITSRVLISLLKKKNLIFRDDLIIDWRPLYDLYCEVAFKTLEEDGVFLLPDGFKLELHNLIVCSRYFFHVDSVQEILDELRPLLCPFDDNVVKAWKLLEVFLPMNFPLDIQPTHGCGLWFDEAMHWYTVMEVNCVYSGIILKIFARLASECPGYIDWTNHVDLFFTQMLRSLRLAKIHGLYQKFHGDSTCSLIAYMFGTECHEKVLDNLRTVCDTVESLLHPSNNAQHTQYIFTFFMKLTANLLVRIKREKTEKSSKKGTINNIPSRMKLNQKMLDEIVTILLPCIKMAIFAKTSIECPLSFIKFATTLAPKVVIPTVLDVAYPALEAVTEPHRLIQALQTLVFTGPIILRDNTYRIHAVTLLNSLLPGLDQNDIAKCMLTFQFIGISANLMALVDCSDAVHVRNDLTEEERDLCSATANFETIMTLFMDKLFQMIIDVGESSAVTGVSGSITTKGKVNMEDNVFHRGTISVFKAFFRNSSTSLYKVGLDKVYSFVQNNVFDSKVCCDIVSDMIAVAVKYYPEVAFPMFYKLIMSKLHNVLSPEVFTEETPDFQVMWWLGMACKLIKLPADLILKHWSDIRSLLDLITNFKLCNDATEKSLQAFEHLLDSLCSIYVSDLNRRRAAYDRPLEEYLPIRHWCEPVDKHTWNCKWHVPNEKHMEKVNELLDDFFVPVLEDLKHPENYDKKEILVRLWKIRILVRGASPCLPLFKGELIKGRHKPTFYYEDNYICAPEGTPVVTINGQHGRELILGRMKDLLAHLLEHSEDDIKSINEIVAILGFLENCRGITQDQLVLSENNYNLAKLMLMDRILGNKSNIEMIVDDHMLLLHKRRVGNRHNIRLRQQNLDILRLLIKLSTSRYSEVRIKAQAQCHGILQTEAFAHTVIMKDLLTHIDPANKPTHEQIKGALHTLLNGKPLCLLMCNCSGEQVDIWPAIVSTEHCEKQSIITLLEIVHAVLVDGFATCRQDYEIPNEMREIAFKLLDIKENSPVNPSHDVPSQNIIDANAHNLEKLRDQRTVEYYSVIDKLVELASNSALHWKQIDMAQAMLSLLVRRDKMYPPAALKLMMRITVHDSIRTRRMGAAVIASWLRINKPKANKRPMPLVIPENQGPGAKWPIKYGLREDNRMMMYEEDKLPKTDEEWDSMQFCGKQHWGFYTWPKEVITYAPLKEQVEINKEREWNDVEKYLLNMLRDPEYSSRFRAFYVVDERDKKDGFNSVNYALFQGIARYFNHECLDIFKDHLDHLIVSEKEQDHKLAAEIIAGLVNGAKLWLYSRQQHMWAWLGPLLLRGLETAKEECVQNWAVCFAFICGSCDPKLLKPLLDVVTSLLNRIPDNAFMASNRFYFVSVSIAQFEWRSIEMWQKFLVAAKPYMTHQYIMLRSRVSLCLVSSAWFDLPHMYIDESLPDALKPVRVSDIVECYNQQLQSCWDESRLCSVVEMNAEVETEVKKQSRLALRGLVSFLYSLPHHSFISMYPSAIKFIPLICHFTNDVGDEELQKSCTKLTHELLQGVLVVQDRAPLFVAAFEQIIKSQCWWKSKIVLNTMLRTQIIGNTFVYRQYREQIGQFLIEAICDSQIEVRSNTALTMSTLLKSGFFKVTPELIETFVLYGKSDTLAMRHGGVLGLSAIILAYPYTVPDFLPDVLMKLCRFASEKPPIKDAVKKTLNDFKRTHLDSWREHESRFNEDQLAVLRDLLISPNYYV